MKNITTAFLLLTISFIFPFETFSCPSLIQSTISTGKHKVYCEITYIPIQQITIVNIGTTVDAIRDASGQPKRFTNTIDAINYMAKLGWEIAEVYGIPKGNDKSTFYFLCKTVENDNDALTGLNLKPIPEGMSNPWKQWTMQ